jgi:hypothetical protein
MHVQTDVGVLDFPCSCNVRSIHASSLSHVALGGYASYSIQVLSSGPLQDEASMKNMADSKCKDVCGQAQLRIMECTCVLERREKLQSANLCKVKKSALKIGLHIVIYPLSQTALSVNQPTSYCHVVGVSIPDRSDNSNGLRSYEDP